MLKRDTGLFQAPMDLNISKVNTFQIESLGSGFGWRKDRDYRVAFRNDHFFPMPDPLQKSTQPFLELSNIRSR